jgi:ribosomal protein S18 acetylase RimI-like enzyme
MHDDYAKHIADGEAWVLEHLGEAIGVVILKDSPGALLIPNIAVIPAAQGQGHGRRLLTFAEQEARQRGVPEVRLFVNALMVENIALYQHLGFREIERIGERGDRAYVQLAKRVTQHK